MGRFLGAVPIIGLTTRLPWYQAKTNRGKDGMVETASPELPPPLTPPFPGSVRVISRDAFRTMISGSQRLYPLGEWAGWSQYSGATFPP